MAAEDSAKELVSAIHSGDVATVVRLIQERPELLSGPLGRGFGTRTALLAAADWPGYFPNGPEIVRILIAAGADPDGRTPGDETPLHWAASSDDAEVAAALIDGGADLQVPDGSIGTPLDNAIGYACWNVARLLVQRGARVDKLWHAAALGLLPRLEELVETQPPPEQETISQAFWHACAGGQRRAAEYLLGRGADLNWVPDYARGTPLDAANGLGTRQENVISWLRDLGARSEDSQ
jgi:uncharacterized protein